MLFTARCCLCVMPLLSPNFRCVLSLICRARMMHFTFKCDWMKMSAKHTRHVAHDRNQNRTNSTWKGIASCCLPMEDLCSPHSMRWTLLLVEIYKFIWHYCCFKVQKLFCKRQKIKEKQRKEHESSMLRSILGRRKIIWSYFTFLRLWAI